MQTDQIIRAPITILLEDFTTAHYFARRYDEATQQALKSIEIEPNQYGIYVRLAEVFELKGMHDATIHQCQKGIGVVGRNTTLLAIMARAYALSGRRQEALKILDELKAMSKQVYVSPYDVAILYVGLGDNAVRSSSLTKLMTNRAGWIIHLNVEPVFDPIRSDPRFGELVKRMKLVS